MAASQPGPKLEKLPELQAQLQYERARVELLKLRAVKVAAKPKRLSTRIFEWFVWGGALLALTGTAAD